VTITPLLVRPPDARWLYVLAHGAGAGMRHPFMESIATALAARAIATLRYEFPYVAAGCKRPDPPGTLVATVREACAAARDLAPDLRLVAGGKSMGGRMTSTALAAAPEPRVEGVIFLGFPLHPAKQPATVRAAHLPGVPVPMLFVQGTRDALAEPALLRPVIAALGPRATLHEIEGADHGFSVPKRASLSGVVVDHIGDVIAGWLDGLAPTSA